MKLALEALIATDPTNPDVMTLQGTINQLQGGVNQLKQAERTADYQSSNDNPPAKLANLQKDITLNQLDIQEKSLELNKEVSRLQLSLAYVNEAIMYPASPVAGVVQRVYVHEGQLVTPGMLLATVAANEIKATAVLTVPQNIVNVLQQGEPSTLMIDGKKVAVTPYFVSTQATDAQLYSVFYDVPEANQSEVSDGEFVTIFVPVGKPKTSATDPFLPIDAVYQTQDESFVLVAKNGKAEMHQIKVGKIFGNYVEVFSGVNDGDQVILDRNVVAGDKVKVD
jgi:membrane fusion protein (multidrug efflux system)